MTELLFICQETTYMMKDSNKLALSIVLTICCLFGFLIKGGKAEIPAGAQVQGTVISNVEINL